MFFRPVITNIDVFAREVAAAVARRLGVGGSASVAASIASGVGPDARQFLGPGRRISTHAKRRLRISSPSYDQARAARRNRR
jgi:hypothetical protein